MIISWARPGHAPSCTHTLSFHPCVYFSAICVFMVETAYSDQLCPSGIHWASSLCARETGMALFWEKPIRKIYASGAHLSDTLSSRLAYRHLCVLLHFPFFLLQNGPPDSLKSIDFTSSLATNRSECSLILNSDYTVLEGCQIHYNFLSTEMLLVHFLVPRALDIC